MVIIALDCFWNPGRLCSPVLATILTLAFPHGNIAFVLAKHFSIYSFLFFFSILLIKFLFYCIMLELFSVLNHSLTILTEVTKVHVTYVF